MTREKLKEIFHNCIGTAVTQEGVDNEERFFAEIMAELEKDPVPMSGEMLAIEARPQINADVIRALAEPATLEMFGAGDIHMGRKEVISLIDHLLGYSGELVATDDSIEDIRARLCNQFGVSNEPLMHMGVDYGSLEGDKSETSAVSDDSK